MDHGPVLEAPPLGHDAACDVAVIGSGIAGLSIAYELTRLGQQVIVIDRGPIGMGMTARSTAHLSSSLDDLYINLIRIHGRDTARLLLDSQVAAINRVEAICAAEKLDADFQRVDGWMAASAPDEEATLKEEYEACLSIGMHVTWADRRSATGLGKGPALVFARQARFHPLKYLAGLATAVQEHGTRLFANTAYESHDKSDGRILIQTSTGAVISATHAVFATNSPVNAGRAFHRKQRPDRTYVIAAPIPKGSVDDVLFWDMHDPYHHMRIQPLDDQWDRLIIGGEDHRTGTENDMAQRLARLEDWARAQYPAMGEVSHRWSGQILETLDYMPFSGRAPGEDNIYLHTGDAGQGITNAVAGALVIAPLITGQHARFAPILDPSRVPLTGRTIAHYLTDQAGVVAGLVQHLTPGEVASADEIAPGEGAVLRNGALAREAVYKSPEGEVIRLSATCTHAGCGVRWNSFEKCWDCPCHGSQFAPTGEVLSGPALKPLPKI